MTRLPEAFFNRPFAHRALHGPDRPENGLSAIRAAVEAGYGIEVDVQRSKDGVAMVFHDAALDRMTGSTGPVRAFDATSLAYIRLAGSKDTVPTLAEALQIIAGQVPLVIEIKDQSGRFGPTDGVLEAAVAGDIAAYAGPVAVMSFNPHSVSRMRDLAPTTPRGLTTEVFSLAETPDLTEAELQALTDMSMLDETGASFISHDVRDLDHPAVARAKAKGLPVLCWTVRSQIVADDALKIADQITFEGFIPA